MAGRWRGRSLRASIATGLLVTALPGAGLAGPAGEVLLELAPIGPTTVPQGRAFEFVASAQNTSPEPVTVDIGFELSGAEGAIAFDGWRVTIAGGQTVRSDRWVVPSQWYVRLGEYRVAGDVDGVPSGDPLPFDVTAPGVVVPLFRDVTEATGLDTTLPSAECARFAAGAAWGDVEGDGDLDLYVPNQAAPAQLWINDGTGHFGDQAPARGVDNGGRIGMGAVFADYDNDGDQDLYVVNDGPNRLYGNDGAGSFVDVAVEAGVDDHDHGSSASWGDYDGDGALDLYVVNYKDCALPEGQPDRLYRNRGDGTFDDVTRLLGPDATIGAGFQAAWFDYDTDGDQDLYLANDFLAVVSEPNRLWRNDGPGGDGWVFTDVSDPSGAGFAINSMGIGLGDHDGDLDLDLAVSNIAGNVLARNNGDGTFTDVAPDARVERPLQSLGVSAITWGLGFADLNLDALEDLFVAAGSLHGASGQAHELFVNGGSGVFLDLSAPGGVAVNSLGRGVAFADYDRDGRMDVYVLNQAGSPVLYRNVTPARGLHWLEVRTAGTMSNRDGCGARLVLTVGSTRLVRQVSCGSIGFASGSDPVVHFGLGPARRAAALEVFWPSGAHQVVKRVDGDRLIVVTEPS